MNDIFICPKEMQKELEGLEETAELLSIKLSLMDQKVRYIFSQIKFCEDTKLLDEYLAVLEKIWDTLTVVVYKYDASIPGRLSRFVHDFDNFEWAKAYYRDKIINGEYTY